MRQIEFRGWDIEKNKWVYGYYIKYITATPYPISTQYERDKFIEEHTKHMIAYDGSSDWGLTRPLIGVDVDPRSVGQWTGNYDELKNKVFEGDILKLGSDRAVVEYDYTEFYAMSIEPNVQGHVSTWCNLISDGTVMGNIFEYEVLRSKKDLSIKKCDDPLNCQVTHYTSSVKPSPS